MMGRRLAVQFASLLKSPACSLMTAPALILSQEPCPFVIKPSRPDFSFNIRIINKRDTPAHVEPRYALRNRGGRSAHSRLHSTKPRHPRFVRLARGAGALRPVRSPACGDSPGDPQGAAAALQGLLRRRPGHSSPTRRADTAGCVSFRQILRSSPRHRQRSAQSPRPQEAKSRRGLSSSSRGNRGKPPRLLQRNRIRDCALARPSSWQALLGTRPLLRPSGLSVETGHRAFVARPLDLMRNIIASTCSSAARACLASIRERSPCR